mgnify:FL=1
MSTAYKISKNKLYSPTCDSSRSVVTAEVDVPASSLLIKYEYQENINRNPSHTPEFQNIDINNKLFEYQ